MPAAHSTEVYNLTRHGKGLCMYKNKLVTLCLCLLLFVMGGCERQPAYSVFERDGVHIEHPEYWDFHTDSDITKAATRKFVFNTGELSYFSLNFMTKEDAEKYSATDLRSYSEFYLSLSPSLISPENTKIKKTDITRAGFKGIKIDMETNVLGKIQEEVLVFHLGGDKDKDVYAIFNSSDNDIISVYPEVERVLKNIRFPN